VSDAEATPVEAPPEPPLPVEARLVWERPDGGRAEFPLKAASILIGRDSGLPICIDEPLVSREHARLEWQQDGFVLIDLGSTNFTRVNGERILRARLESGDEVRFARAVCRLLVEGGAAPPAEPA